MGIWRAMPILGESRKPDPYECSSCLGCRRDDPEGLFGILGGRCGEISCDYEYEVSNHTDSRRLELQSELGRTQVGENPYCSKKPLVRERR